MKIILGFVAISSLMNCGVVSAANEWIRQGIDDKNVTPKLINIKLSELWPDVRNDKDLILLGQVLEEIERGRGKSHKYKKLTKTLYPLFMGVLIAKVVLIPLILKMLTAVSMTALVMSKIALITTGLLALKWIFSGSIASDAQDYTHFELVYVPPKSEYSKPYRSLKFSDDQSWSDSNFIPATATNKQTAYIPLNTILHNEVAYRNYEGISDAAGKSNPNVAAATSDLYRYNQHNYYSSNKLNDGKPFL